MLPVRASTKTGAGCGPYQDQLHVTCASPEILANWVNRREIIEYQEWFRIAAKVSPPCHHGTFEPSILI